MKDYQKCSHFYCPWRGNVAFSFKCFIILCPFSSITMIGIVLGFSRILDASFCAWAVNVSTEGWTHLVTELLSPFNQPTSWWWHQKPNLAGNRNKILICRVPADAFRIPAGSFCFCRLDVWGLWHSVAGDKKPWILVTQSSGIQRLGPPPQASNQAFLCPAISYHFNFHSRQLFARKSHGVVIPKSKYCHPPPSSQSHVSPHKLRQKNLLANKH